MSSWKTIFPSGAVLCLLYVHVWWLLLDEELSRGHRAIPAAARSRFHLDASGLRRRGNGTKVVLLWNDFFDDYTWEVEEGWATFERLRCPVNDCFLTNDRAMAPNSAAILFHGPTMKDEPPRAPRPARQRWVYVVMENALSVADAGRHSASWRGQFNWTMSYRLDSDILLPYGEVKPDAAARRPDRDYLAIAKSKRRLVAWMVSHCDTSSRRERYVRELQKYVPVDVYGECGQLTCVRNYRERDQDCQALVNRTYLFYLAFENAHCVDYITEKLFRILPLDVVPIVRGTVQGYERQIPRKWYINTEEFSSPKHLAAYLLHLRDHPEEYVKFFTGKDQYKFIYHMGLKQVPSWCELCHRLHDPEEPIKMYPDITSWWSVKDCVDPDDIPYEIIPIVIGVSVALIVLATIITVSCFFCRCCPGYKKRQKRLQKAEEEQQQQQLHDLPDIAVQASGQPLPPGREVTPAPSCDSPVQYFQHQASCTASPSSCTQNEVLHCGCQWSPSLQHSPMTDLESIMKQLYGDTELEPLSEIDGDKPPPYTEHDIHKFELPKIETKTLGRRFKENKEKTTVNESNTKVTRAISDPSQLCMKTFRPVMQMRLSPRFEADAKRDSGVLVEEGEGAADGVESALILQGLQAQPVLRSPAFLGCASSQSSLEVDTADIKASIHSPGGFCS